MSEDMLSQKYQNPDLPNFNILYVHFINTDKYQSLIFIFSMIFTVNEGRQMEPDIWKRPKWIKKEKNHQNINLFIY